MELGQIIEEQLPCLVRFFQNKIAADYEDLVQQTIVRGLEGYQRRGKAGSFEAYLYGVARNVLYEAYRHKKRGAERSLDVNLDSVEDLADGPSTFARARSEKSDLLAALRRLALEDQCILELYFWENLNAREIGEAFQMAEGTVRSKIRRSKARLLELLRARPDAEGRAPDERDLDRWAAEVRHEWEG